MDNNTGNRPRKRVSKKVLRQRQIGALTVIALLVLLFFIAILKGCSNSSDGKKGGGKVTTTTTALATTTVPQTTVITTTTHPLNAEVLLSRREMFINVGGSDVSIINSYPTGSAEVNEVWKSLDPTIATVDGLGHVTGVSEGETFIILSFDNNPGVEIEIKVHVAGGAEITTAVSPVITIDPVVTPTDAILDFTITTTPVAAVNDDSVLA